MIIFPAIDLKLGQCVRLKQGQKHDKTVYDENPLNVAKEWVKQDSKFIHIVDLDGAFTGDGLNRLVIKQIAQNLDVKCQVGGGIRSIQDCQELIDSGVNRIILGTKALDKVFLKAVVEQFGDKVAVSIDALDGFVCTEGWVKKEDIRAIDFVKELELIGVKTIVYTDIKRDGMLKGPNFEQLKEMNEATSIDVIASGGVSTMEDLKTLSEMGLYGAIIGKALYENKVDLSQINKIYN